jgi:prepilin-type N-terminal cleavage/methylation domain-containing protein
MRAQQTRDNLRVMQRHSDRYAFTLIELLVVIAIIATLLALLFPSFSSIYESARKTQAKNDLTQIVTAVNAYYTEYGKYPLAAGIAIDTTFGPSGTANQTLFNSLRGGSLDTTLNPRQIVFISPPDVKNPTNPRSGIATQATATVAIGDFVDPWGSPYNVEIDGNYDNQIPTNPYTADTGAGPGTLNIGVIAWAFGKNGALGGGPAATTGFTSEGGTAGSFSGSGDVISWQ